MRRPPPPLPSVTRTPTAAELARYRAKLAHVQAHEVDLRREAREIADHQSEQAFRELTGAAMLDPAAAGAAVRTAREKAGLSPENAAAGTRFDADDLRALEAGAHPAPTLGMLRQFAGAVGLRLRVELEPAPAEAAPPSDPTPPPKRVDPRPLVTRRRVRAGREDDD